MKNLFFSAVMTLVLASSVMSQSRSRTDWDFDPGWKNSTVYSNTYVVSQRHPKASDDNSGTAEAPFRTIGRAARVVKAGERVLIHAGVYKETIRPQYGGAAPDKMISYEAANGDEVVIKGSSVITQPWSILSASKDSTRDTTLSYARSKKVWLTTLDDAFFENGYFPLKLMNIAAEEYAMMPWAARVKNASPYNSPRALIFQNGKRMLQMNAYGDVAKVVGSFWVDKDGKTVHIHSFDGGDPNGTLLEIGVARHLFIPVAVGLNYIQVRGLRFEHCANGFLRTSTGAVTSLGGHHWIFEDNTISQVNSSGLEFGYYAFEETDPDPLNKKSPRKRSEAIGGTIVRNNTISECGTAGIRSHVVADALIEGNHVFNCGWQNAERYYEVSGIKILIVSNSLVRRNHIHDITGGNAIWLDWDNKGSRVTQNIIHDISTAQAGIFVEASQYPNLVDNNFIWNITANGVQLNDSDSVKVYHNLIANFSGSAVNGTAGTSRSLNGRRLSSEHNHIANNIFINGRPSTVSKSSVQENNLYVNTSQPNFFTDQALKAAGETSSSSFMYATSKFVPSVLFFDWQSNDSIPSVPSLKEVKHDFKGSARKTVTVPGPFGDLTKGYWSLLKE